MTKLLLVEDNLTFCTMLSTWLRKKGFEVETASSVGSAVKALLSEKTKLISYFLTFAYPTTTDSTCCNGYAVRTNQLLLF